jgi:hypothetical protein
LVNDVTNTCSADDKRNAGAYLYHYHIWFHRENGRDNVVIQHTDQNDGNKHRLVFLKFEYDNGWNLSIKTLDTEDNITDYCDYGNESPVNTAEKKVFRELVALWDSCLLENIEFINH